MVTTLMAIGTGYDLYITRKYTRGRNVMYDLERHAKLEQLAVGNEKPLSGKDANDFRLLRLVCPSPVNAPPFGAICYYRLQQSFPSYSGERTRG